VDFDDLFRRLAGDLFDLDAARSRGHDDRLARRPVVGDPQVDFLLNTGRFIYQHLAYRQPFDLHAQNLSGELLGFLCISGQPHAPGLAAPADQNLGLDNGASAQLFSDLTGCCSCLGNTSARDRDPIASENLFGLVFVKFHIHLYGIWNRMMRRFSVSHTHR